MKLRSRITKLVLALAAVLACLAPIAGAAQAAGLEIDEFFEHVVNQDGTPSESAGARPYKLINQFALHEDLVDGILGPTANIKDASFNLPPGIVGNAASIPTCPQSTLAQLPGRCPLNSQVGTARIRLNFLTPNGQQKVPVYNMEAPKGMPAQFGFLIIASVTHINFKVRTGTDYGVTATVHQLNSTAPVSLSEVTIWGVPGDPGHDDERCPGCADVHEGNNPYPDPSPVPVLLSNPTSCGRPLLTAMTATSWQRPDELVTTIPSESPAMTDCNQLEFAPSIEAKPTTNLADSPSGLEFHLHIPQNQDPTGTAVAHLRTSKVVLPDGVTVNPASANGLGACNLEQIGYTGQTNEKQSLRFDADRTASFTVAFRGATTAPIRGDAASAQVQQALETLPGLAGNVTLAGQPGAWDVSFTGALADTDQPDLSGATTANSVQRVEAAGADGGYELQFGGASAAATFTASFAAGESFITASNASRQLLNGAPISGPGIAPETTASISEFAPSLVSLSKPTVSDQTDAALTAGFPFNASVGAIEAGLNDIAALDGNVKVFDVGTVGTKHTFEVAFKGSLAGTEPPLLTSTSFGTGAEVTITQEPGSDGALREYTSGDHGIPQFTPGAARCPEDSKLGTVRIDTPTVIDHPLEGSVYLATPHQNPFGSLLAMYITVADEASGVVLKLPGVIEADPKTGQLTATVSEAPQLPFEDLKLEFFRGAAAPLKTGIACGSFNVNTDMVPWSAPAGPTMHPKDTFTITRGAGGGPCSSSEATAPKDVKFEAGTLDPTGGIYSPFVLKLSRPDGSQQLTGLDTTLPKGLIAKLAGVTYCSDAALASAAGKDGRAEQASSSCPASSQVGTVNVGAGAGPTPFYAGGKAYLAGPYRGAPLSLAVVTPAVAGPFDLGTVVVRNALFVDPETTAVRAVSDPLPTMLQGIPLDLRSVVVDLDRDRFTRNPTSCNPLAISGSASTLAGQSASLSSRFQVGECGRLAFKPKLALKLEGGTKRSGHPALKAVLTARDGEANIASGAVTLPRSEFLENAHIKTICTRVQFAARSCPPNSVYGKARVFTPLLDKPLEGPLYLRSSNHELPDLVADLKGQIEVVLVGRIDSVNRGIRATFESVPDAPVTKFVLEQLGGKKGLLVNNRDLCKSVNRANAIFDGQNGKSIDSRPIVTNSCKKKKPKKAAKAKKRSSR